MKLLDKIYFLQRSHEMQLLSDRERCACRIEFGPPRASAMGMLMKAVSILADDLSVPSLPISV